ncbi:SDR family NAD(P)-dependent oxidoreductase [Chryseolinea soli]|nr:SDR family NAD(P)-dependent oxidoreductase [Chryseolinea soli]
MSKTIFITGASKGFGRIWATAALERGDNVIATARRVEDLNDLKQQFGSSVLAIQLDVRNKAAGAGALRKSLEHFGSLDVVINNAGYGLFGAIEENSEEEVRAQMETNFFGALWITQAAIPIMRKQRHGHIIQVSSIGGVIALPVLGIYHASKWAMEGFSESLSKEVAEFGIKITLVEPGGYATDWGGSSSFKSKPVEGYEQTKEFVFTLLQNSAADPQATGQAILKVIDAENPPLRIFLGDMLPLIKPQYLERLQTWENWSAVSVSAQ